jgi:hypothetical protein
MALSKKDYEAVAGIVKRAREVAANKAIHEPNAWVGGANIMSKAIALGVADYFAADNPRFDRVRFLKACGLSE